MDTVQHCIQILLNKISDVYICNAPKPSVKCLYVGISYKSSNTPDILSYGFMSVLYEKQRGFTYLPNINDKYIERELYDEMTDSWITNFFIEQKEDKEIEWYSTFKELKNNVKLNYPNIYSSEDFLDKIDQTFMNYN